MMAPGRWALSPAYDLNPAPEIDRALTPKTAISGNQENPTIDAALEAGARFDLKTAEARIILRELHVSVSGWRKTARQLRIKASTRDACAAAFEHPLMDEARHLL